MRVTIYYRVIRLKNVFILLFCAVAMSPGGDLERVRMVCAIIQNPKNREFISQTIRYLHINSPEISAQQDITKPCASQYLMGLAEISKIVKALVLMEKHDPIGERDLVQRWSGNNNVNNNNLRYAQLFYLLFAKHPKMSPELLELLQEYVNLRNERINLRNMAYVDLEQEVFVKLSKANNAQIDEILDNMSGENGKNIVFPYAMGWVSAAWHEYPVGLSSILATTPECIAKLRASWENNDKKGIFDALKSLDMILRSTCCLISAMIDSEIPDNPLKALKHFKDMRKLVEDFMSLYRKGFGNMYNPWLKRIDRLILLANRCISVTREPTSISSKNIASESATTSNDNLEMNQEIYINEHEEGMADYVQPSVIELAQFIDIDAFLKNDIHSISPVFFVYNPYLIEKISYTTSYFGQTTTRYICEVSSGNVAPRQQIYTQAKSRAKIRYPSVKQVFMNHSNGIMLLLAFLLLNLGFPV